MKANNPKFLKVRGTFHGLSYIDLLLVMLSVVVADNMGLEGVCLLIAPIIVLVARYSISRLFSLDDLVFLVSKRKTYKWNHSIGSLKNANE